MKHLNLTLLALLLSFASFAVAPITGTTSICEGSTTYLSDTTPGGSWSSSSSLVASLVYSGTTGTVYGLSAGTATITYDVGGVYATTTVTVFPVSPIGGITSICLGTATTLSDIVTGGTWSSSNTAVAPVGLSTGIVSGVSAGYANITYTTGGGCESKVNFYVITSLPPISGPVNTCVGGTTVLTDDAGGTWSSGSLGIATIGAGTGIVTGIAAGTSMITYTIGGTCTTTRTDTVISGLPPITGGTGICEGSTTTLSDATSGGVWSSSSFAIAYVGSTMGMITGVSSGTATITYSLGTGCSATITVTVSASSPVTGLTTLCIGSTTVLSDATSGGTWSSSIISIATVGYTTGVVTGIALGTSAISYTTGAGCTRSVVVNVVSSPPSITGPDNVCIGLTNGLLDATPGGTWSSSSLGIATIDLSLGYITGVAAGTSTITYTIGGSCYTTRVDTVISAPGAITGVTWICKGAATTLSDAGGGVWSSSNYSVANILGTVSSVVTGVSAGTATITYSLGTGCAATITVTVFPLPSVTAALTHAACGSTDTLTGGGAGTYSWSPTTGLSCPSCAVTSLDPAATTTYVVTGTDALGCTNTASQSVNGNRIYGHITFSSYTPDTLDMKVWLIYYNPTDSSITALDSAVTCDIDSIDYYEFDGRPAGNYLVKAKLVYDNPVGSTGYIPTYGLSSAYWYSASTIAHYSGSDSLHINMASGTVPPGPGFIGGYVYSGAGKGTSGDVPVAGMLIYLQNTSSNILSHTYTDATGAYKFSGLDYGNYVIYPEAYGYYTTPSSALSLNTTNYTLSSVDFKQFTTSRIIVPVVTTGIKAITSNDMLNVYPNPTTGVLNIQWSNQHTGNATVRITDITGRTVYNNKIGINTVSGQTAIDVENLKQGIYFISITSDHISYNAKLMIGQ